MALAFLAMFGLVLMTPLRKIVRPLMRKPGEGPSKEVRENGWFGVQLLKPWLRMNRFLFLNAWQGRSWI